MEQNTSLYHHGIKGQRWGVRRFQNKNGTLTRAGRKRYAKDADKEKPKGLTVEEAKAQVLNSRSAKMVYDNRKLLNKQEMKEAYDILKLDDDVKKLIVKDPSKLDKFLTRTGDLATKIKNIVDPAVATIAKINSLMKVLDGNSPTAKTNNSNSDDKNNKPKEDPKPPIDLKKLFEDMPEEPAYYDAHWEASESTKSFVSGYLPGPKEED